MQHRVLYLADSYGLFEDFNVATPLTWMYPVSVVWTNPALASVLHTMFAYVYTHRCSYSASDGIVLWKAA